VSGSPIITGVIGVSELPVSKPRRVSSALNRPVLAHSPVLELGLVAHDPDRLATGGHHGRRVRGREEERSRALGEELAEGHRAGHVPAERPDRLRQRSDLDGDPAVQVEMVDAPSPVAPEDARRVGVVDHDGRTELLGRLDDAGERRDVAVHREHAVGHDEDQPVLAAARPSRRAGLARTSRRAATSPCG
jgi:hypothetical protein